MGWLSGNEDRPRRRSRKRQVASSLWGGTKRAGRSIRPKSKHNTNLVIVGLIFAAVVDAGYFMYKAPGYKTPSPFGPKIYWGDVAQLGLYVFLLFVGITQARGDLTSFGFGLTAGKTFTSVIFPSAGWPRYLLFKVDPETGKLSSTWGS